MEWFTQKHYQTLDQKLDSILRKTEEILASNTQGLTDLQNALAAETVQSALVVSTLQGLSTQIAALNAQVAALQAQLAAGTEVTDTQLETFAQGLEAAEASVTAALPAAPTSTPTAQVKKPA